jgi:hypothetical protein
VSERYSVTLPDGLAEVVDGLAQASGTTGEVPTLSKSRVLRLLAADGAQNLADGDLDVHDGLVAPNEEWDADDIQEILPKHVLGRYLYEERKNQNWIVDMRGGFEKRVRDRLEERFKNGYDPEVARELAEGYIGEAFDFWVRLEDDRETFEQKKAWVLDRIDDYRERYETTAYDPDEEFLASFTGVEEGETEARLAEVAPQIRAIAEDRFRERRDRGRDAVVDAIDRHYEVPREAIAEIVDDVRRELIEEDHADDGVGGGRDRKGPEEIPEDAEIRLPSATGDGEPDEVAKPTGNGTTIKVEDTDD